jgi:hypothetical protein
LLPTPKSLDSAMDRITGPTEDFRKTSLPPETPERGRVLRLISEGLETQASILTVTLRKRTIFFECNNPD